MGKGYLWKYWCFMNNNDFIEVKNMKFFENWVIKNFIDLKVISNVIKNFDY